MRRRLVACGATLALLPVVQPAAGAANPPPTPVVAGSNRLISSGAHAVPLLISRPFTLDMSLSGVSLSSSSPWAGFFVVHQPLDGRPPTDPWMFGILQARVGCTATASSAAVCSDSRVLRILINHPAAAGARAGRFPAGRYVAYLLTSAGSRVAASWTFASGSGHMTAVAREPVRWAWLAGVSGTEPVIATYSGTARQTLHREGVLFDVTWATTAPGTVHAADWNLCVRKGDDLSPPGPVGPGEYCSYTDGLAWFPGSPASSVTRSNLGAEYGQELQTRSSGLSAEGLVAMLVRPGKYTVPYSVHVAGPSPRAGVLLLSWQYV